MSAAPARPTLFGKLFAPVPAGPLAGFRVVFGVTMLYHAVLYAWKGLPALAYDEPPFLFKYWGFEWVTPDLLPWSVQTTFYGMVVFAGLFTLGLCYRLSAALLWAAFTYVFLLEQAFYLNHYYLVSLLAFLFIWVPAHRAFSLDAVWRPSKAAGVVPWWATNVIRFQVGVAYFYGGIAKLYADWFAGLPAGFMLTGKSDRVPLLGPYLDDPRAVTVMAWGGVVFDLLIVQALVWRRTRPVALLAAVGFHLTNHYLFTIGIFPWLMLIGSCVLWPPGGAKELTPLGLLRLAVGLFALTRGLDALLPAAGGAARPVWWAGWHLFGLAAAAVALIPKLRSVGVLLCGAVPAAAAVYAAARGGAEWEAYVVPAVLAAACGLLAWPPAVLERLRFGDAAADDGRAPEVPAAADLRSVWGRRAVAGALAVYVGWQVLMPLRHHLYPGDVAWTEEGHKWSWRMKLRVRRTADQFGTWFEVDDGDGVPITVVYPKRAFPKEFLHGRQARELQCDPDLIIQFARYLREHYEAEGRTAPVTVRVRCSVSLNGHPPAVLIDPAVDMAAADWPLGPKPWVLRENAPSARGDAADQP